MPNHVKIRPLAAERKLSRGLFEQLAEQIKSGRLAPGARLPTEHALTRAARVSRTVVREAVAALRAEGLVITRQGVGAFEVFGCTVHLISGRLRLRSATAHAVPHRARAHADARRHP